VRTIAVDIELLFGVDVSTKAEINSQLSQIISEIEPVKIKFVGDFAEIERQAKSLGQSISSGDKSIHLISPDSTDGLNRIIEQLTEIVSLVREINSKEFNITASFGVGNKTDIEELRLYKAEAETLIRLVDNMQSSIAGLSSPALTQALSGQVSQFLELSQKYKGTDAYLGDLGAANTISSVRKIISVLGEYRRVYEVVLEQAKLPIDTSSFDRATAALEEYQKRRAEAVANLKDALSPTGTNTTAATASSTTESLDKFKTLSTDINNILLGLRSKIEETFNLSTIDLHADELKSQLSELLEMAKQVREAMGTGTGGTTNGGNTQNVGDGGAALADAKARVEAFGELARESERVYDTGNKVSEVTRRQAADNAILTGTIRRLTDAQGNEVETVKITKDHAAATRQASGAQEIYNRTVFRADDALKRYAGAQTSSLESSREAYSSISAQREELDRLWRTYQKDHNFQKFKSGVYNVDRQIQAQTRTLRENGEETTRHQSKLKSAISMYFSFYRAIMLAVRGLRSMVKASMELDKAMTQMQIVTGATDAEMQKFSETAFVAADRAASNITDIISGATTYARLGFDSQTSTALAEYTAMLQNVGDINAQDAQDAITAIIKAFDGVDETNIKEKLDELVVVGNNFPISVSQVAEGMNNASSALAAAGNSYEKSVALLTAANTTMQNASKASTGLRTITARLRNTKTELDDLGEAMTESQYDEVVNALTDMHVALVDVNGEYRDTYDVFKDIAAQWDDMSSMEQAALATKLSGTRMQAVFYSLVQNFGEAEKAYKAMGAAEGELVKKNEIYANSVEGRMTQFKNEFKKLASEIFTSDWIVDVVGMAKDLLHLIADIAKAITGVMRALGGIKGTLFAITLLMANIKIASIARSAATLLETGKKLTVMQSLALSLTGKQTAANAGMALSFKQIATSAKEAAVAWLTSPIGAATVVAGATALFVRQIQKSSEQQSQEMADAIKAYEEVKGQVSESEGKIADLNGELKTTRDRLAELSRIKSPTYVEQDELEKAKAMTAELEKQIEDEEKLLKYRRTAEMPAFNDMVWNNLVSADRSFFSGQSKSQKFLASLGLFKDNYGNWSNIIPQSYVTEGADFRPFLTSDSSAVDVLLKLPTLVEMAQAIIEANKGDPNARYSIKTGLSETDDINFKSSDETRPLWHLIDFVEDSSAVYAKTITELTEMVDGAELILNPSNKEEEDYNWNIRKINSIIHLFEHELGDDPRRMGAFEDTAAMWGFSSYEEFLAALRSGDERARWFIDDLNDMGIATGEVKGRFHVLGQELRDTESDTKDLSTAVKSLRQALSEVSQVKTGLDQLDKIYADILNGGKFDYTTLIDENFTELFGNLDSFDDFIHTVANAPDDIDACQAAFNRLTSEFIVQSGCLQDLDEDTRAMMLRFLAEQGVIDDTGEAADRLTQIYRVLDAQKKLLEEHKLDTSSDVDALITLATQADATSASIIRLTNAKAMLAKAEAIGIQIDSNPKMDVKEAQRLEQLAQRLTEQAAAILSKPIEFDLLEVNYSGGDTTQGVRDSIAKETEKATEQSSEKIKTWFEEQYAEHKHLVAMEKETDYEYYTWLEGAMKKAYAEGILSQEDYWKYEEEVYNGMKKLRENAEKEAQSNLDKLVDIRKKMLEKEVSDQKDALNDQLKNLKDFYDKQKKMLQDSYDEEDYLEEQAEKRKSVSDLEEELARLRYDDSAWAQKRRAEISQQIADARKDLNDFERDHARDEALSFLDEQESAAEEKINAQIETLDEKYKSAKELYEQALADVKNGSVELYREMIKWNGEYGDGIDDTITSAWEGAYQALSDYNTLFGKTFKGVNLANVTGYVLKPVGTGYASGTSYAVPGLHPIDEKGSETYFSPSTGGKYKMFSGGEKVLTAKASDFLYRFANGGSEMLKKFIASVGGGVLNDRVSPLMTNNEIVMGDVVINGNPDRATISEIRRAQRESVEFMLKEFGKLNR